MSYSKRWVQDPRNQKAVLALYRSRSAPTLQQVAETLGTHYSNVSHVVKQCLPLEERKALARVRYSASKTGNKNPMRGKSGSAHHLWKGDCEDGNGYLTQIQNGKRRFVHRAVAAEMLGLPEIPRHLVVHHIDNNPKNNSPDNLAIVTKAGHRAVHYLQAEDSLLLRSRKSSIADALKYMT